MPASALRDSLEQAAVEDFQFALDKFEHCGYDHFPHIMEHTYNTSPSLYHATMSWAASQLFMLTGNKRYGEIAVSSIGYAMECQEGEGVCPGYFYTELTTKVLDTDYFKEFANNHVPMKRYGREGELNAGAIFLASDEASYVTGVILPIDGGYTAV